MRAVAFVLAITTMFGAALVGQQPARDRRTVDTAGTGAIRGRVFASDTGAPLAHAYVSLDPSPDPKRSSMLTDLDGRFEFTGLPAGRYRLTASKRGYLQLEFGQRRPRQNGKPIELAKGAVMEPVDFVLPPAGAISGTVTDDLGEPLERARVTVLRSEFSRGLKRLVPVAPASYLELGYTNDLGQYRISGLPPGTYYVGVQPPYSNVRADESSSFAPTYYPGTDDMTQAQRIVLKIGQQRAGADIMVVSARPARVSGVVVNSLGQPASGASVGASQSVGDMSMSTSYGSSRTTTRADGRFVIVGLPPGSHTLSASLRDPVTNEIERGETTVAVAGAPVDGVTVTMLAPVRVTGRIRIDPSARPPFPVLPRLRVMASSLRFDFAVSIGLVKDRDGSFDVGSIPPGPRRRFYVADLPGGWGVKSVRCQGRDITDGGIDIGPNQNLSGIEIVVSNENADLGGTVTDANGQPVDDYVVVVFSDSPSRWAPGRSVMSARPDQTGRFTMRDLRPGNYFAVALEYLETGAEYDPEVLGPLREVATPLKLADGEKKTIQLRIVTQ